MLARNSEGKIDEYGFNRVVVAALTNKAHEPFFKDIIEEGRLNLRLLEFVNIREHDSFVHMGNQKRPGIRQRTC